MRFPPLALFIVSLAAINALAHTAEDDRLSARELVDYVLDTREVFDDLGLHSRAVAAIKLSSRRIEELEERMGELENELVARIRAPPPPPANTWDCPWADCDFITANQAEIATHIQAVHGGRQPPANRRRKARK